MRTGPPHHCKVNIHRRKAPSLAQLQSSVLELLHSQKFNHLPMPNSFWILPPSFTNFVSALVGQLRICSYHSFVVSKKPARSRRRCSVYFPVFKSSPAFVMPPRNISNVGSISRFFRSSSTMRNVSHTSGKASTWSRLSPITWTSFTMRQPCNSLRLLLTLERATSSVSLISLALSGFGEI